jgi:hypothetical protein
MFSEVLKNLVSSSSLSHSACDYLCCSSFFSRSFSIAASSSAVGYFSSAGLPFAGTGGALPF